MASENQRTMLSATSPQPSYMLSAVNNFGRPTVRVTFQLKAELGVGTEPPIDILNAARRVCLDWVRRRFRDIPNIVPRAAYSGDGFEIDMLGQLIQCASARDLNLWALRLRHPDAPFMDNPAVPGRTWTVDLALAVHDNRAIFSIRVLCSSLAYSDEPIALTTPRIIADLVRAIGLRDVKSISKDAWLLKSENDLLALADLIMKPDRILPVYLLTESNAQEAGLNVSPFVLDPTDLGKNTLGLAHVCLMPNHLSYKWSDMVGREWAVYGGAARIYRPMLNFEQDSPYSHPKFLLDKIIAWHYLDRVGEIAFCDYLVDRSRHESASKRLIWSPCRFIEDLRPLIYEQERNSRRGNEQQSDAFQREIVSLKTKIDELEKECEAYNDESLATKRECDHLREINQRLAYQNDGLREAIRAKGDTNILTVVQKPTSYDSIGDWVQNNFAGRLEFHPRALRGLKDGQYEDLSLVCDSLSLLAEEYRNMKLGYASREIFEDRLKSLGLELSNAITETRAGEEGNTYYVNYPLGSARKRKLDLHLTKGSSRDQRYCLRVYFFWDEESQSVIVGWLPSHLDTRVT